MAQSRPELFEGIAQKWTWTQMCARTLDLAFIGVVDGAPLTEAEALALRQIAALHVEFRASLSRRAPRDVLKALSEERVAAIERDQMPVTASMAAILKEAHALISADDLGALAFMRANAIEVNQKDRDGLTASAVAAQNGADKCLFSLCKNQANPHVGDAMGNSPLHWACAMARPKAMSVLLYHGANPNAVSDNGVTPLMLALTKSNIELAQKLLEYGADLGMRDRRGNTALHRAVLAKSVPVVKFLLDSGASMEEPNQDGATALGLAMRAPELAVMFCEERACGERPRNVRKVGG